MTITILIPLLFMFGINANSIGVFSGCSISVNEDLGEPQPLLLKPGGPDYDAIVLPEDNSGTITFAGGDSLQLACPGGNLLLNSSSTGLSIANATCVSGTVFRVNTHNVTFSSITCSGYPWHTARYTGSTCVGNYKEIEVGFEVGDRFLRHLLSCFDDAAQNVKWVEFNLTKEIGGYQRGFPRPSFLQGTFYTVGTPNVNTLYTGAQQRITINNLLGLNVTSTKYVAASGDYYLARGHLAAKADFVFGAQHRLTFYYINAAPQWQTFNGGNWMYLESDVRNFASNRGLDLVVYTGTYGATTLPHEITGEDVELHLYRDANNNNGLAVPQLYWKLVYEPISKAGIVFVGVNNPYHDDKQRNVVCTADVIGRISWLTVSANNQKLGYMYACTVEDFARTVDFLPNLQVNSLLV